MQVFTEAGAPRVDLDLKPIRPKNCVPGQTWRIGDLVFVPSGRGDRFSVTVKSTAMMGNCDADQPTGCIQASRRIGYQSHTSLDLPIFLSTVCLNKKCDPGTTCSPEDGMCHSDVVVTSDAGSPIDAGGAPDVGVVDANPTVCAYPNPVLFKGGKPIHAWHFDEPVNDVTIFDEQKNSVMLSNFFAHVPSNVAGCGNALSMKSPDPLPLKQLSGTGVGIAVMVMGTNLGSSTVLFGNFGNMNSNFSLSLLAGMSSSQLDVSFDATRVVSKQFPCKNGLPLDNKFHLLEIYANNTMVSCAVDGQVFQQPNALVINPTQTLSLGAGQAGLVIDDLRIYDAP